MIEAGNTWDLLSQQKTNKNICRICGIDCVTATEAVYSHGRENFKCILSENMLKIQHKIKLYFSEGKIKESIKVQQQHGWEWSRGGIWTHFLGYSLSVKYIKYPFENTYE